MNIFFLDYDVKKCAQYHVDKHVVKMILETAQLLCGVHHVTVHDTAHDTAHDTPQVNPQVSFYLLRRWRDLNPQVFGFGDQYVTNYTTPTLKSLGFFAIQFCKFAFKLYKFSVKSILNLINDIINIPMEV